MAKRFKVASVQFNPVREEREQNIAALADVVTEAAQNGAKLIVTPEMATTGYHYRNREAISPYVDTIPGITTDAFLAICQKYAAYVVIGMPEVDSQMGVSYDQGKRGLVAAR